MHVGEVIRRLRKERKMTLLELSSKSGVALATLSRMENGRMTGTLQSHMKISESLGISLPDLYRDLSSSRKQVDVQERSSRAEVSLSDKSATSEMLASRALDKKMLPVMIRIRRGGSTHKDQTKPGVEKFLYVLEGKLEAVIGEERYDLSGGDTLYFGSQTPHHFRNPGTSETRLICVTCPPNA